MLSTWPTSESRQEFCALDLFLDAKEAKIAVKGKACSAWHDLLGHGAEQ